jgi:hypothetical protein
VFLRESANTARDKIKARLEAEMIMVAAMARQDYIGHERKEWPPLARSTVDYKRQHGYTGKVSATDPLLRTGLMRDSVEGGAEGLTGVVGSNDPVAVYQELGTSKIPPRPFISSAMMESIPAIDHSLELLAVQMLLPKP